MTIFATLTPIDPGTNERVTVRLCASQDEASTGAVGETWWPAIVTQPVIQARFFDGDFSSSVDAPSAGLDVRLDVLKASGQFPRVERYDWAGAECRLQRLSGGVLVDVALMLVDSFASEDLALGLRLSAARELFDADVLRSTYAGTTGAEGGADLKGQLKPWVFGRALNIEPVFIDQIDNVFQVSGYGAVQAISAVYERGASFGASMGDFATYAALVAANIPEGRWGTCLAQGMFRLGAPPAGVITCDVDGDNVGGFLRRTGAIIAHIATRIGLVDKINTTSTANIDAAVPRNVNIVIREQISFMELAQRMFAPCNAVASVGQSGRLIASRVTFGTELFTLDAQGREMPAVLGMARQNTQPPYKRIQMGGARSWRVHTFDEIAFFADLIDRGIYSAAEVYREGNIVETADKARWVYTNPTASSGNAPPPWPTTSNTFWSNIAPPISGDLIGGIVAPANANRVPFSRMEGDRGWKMGFNPWGLATTTTFGELDGRRFARVTATATAAGQQVTVGTNAASGRAFVVTPGERLSIQSRVEAVSAAAGATWSFVLWLYGTAGAQTAYVLAAGSAPVGLLDAPRSAFLTVPSGMVAGRLEYFVIAGAAGTMVISASVPMVTSAAVGQTVHPPFSPGPNASDGADPNNLILIGGDGRISGIGTANIYVDNRTGQLQGLLSARPASGAFINQTYLATDTREVFQWDGFNWGLRADLTAVAQRSIEPQFPVIEIKQGEAGHTGNRTVTHTAKRGTLTITGGTWSLVSENLGAGDATINSGTGTVTLSGIVQSGAYSIRYTHTDGLATDLAVNVTYVAAASAGVVSAKRQRATSTNGTANNRDWQTILSLTVSGSPAGRADFGGFNALSFLEPTNATGTADFEARILLDGATTLTSVPSQRFVTGGALELVDLSALFSGTHGVTSGNRTFDVQLRRTGGTGVLVSTNTVLEATIIAS